MEENEVMRRVPIMQSGTADGSVKRKVLEEKTGEI